MSRLLRQKPHGALYTWTEALSQRPDMEEVIEETAKQAAPVVEQDLSTDTPITLDAMNEDQLREYAVLNGITIPGTVRKLETIRAKIREAMPQ